MKAQKTNTAAKKENHSIGSLFGKDNFNWMLIGAAVLVLGFILMAGGASKDPNVFDPNQVYSPVRITVAPIIILLGFIIEIYAIFRRPKNDQGIF
jgi:Protein of unknown function (DUF3098)